MQVILIMTYKNLGYGDPVRMNYFRELAVIDCCPNVRRTGVQNIFDDVRRYDI
jgi:hypothetical protein